MHFEKPAIHNVKQVRATATRIAGSGGPFSTIEICFSGVSSWDGDGTEDAMKIFFTESVPHEYVEALAAAINSVSENAVNEAEAT